MVVGLNALFLDPGVSGGSETYIRGLVPELVTGHPGTRFELATTRRGADALIADGWGDLLPVLRMPCDDDAPIRRTAAEQVGLSRLGLGRGWDVLHTLSNRGPRFPRMTSVVTLHDVIFFHHRTLGRLSTAGMRLSARGAVAGADMVIAATEVAVDDISATLGVERSRLVSIPHGTADPPRAAPDPTSLRRELELTGARVVLCVGALRPHKNQRLLVEALPQLPDDVALVLVGHDEGQADSLRNRAKELRVSDRMRLLEYADDDRMERLWALAGAAAFPTKAEGFGLPPLEAMARRVPVACSDIPVLREVVGDAARFFDPDDPAAAAGAIAAALQERADLTARGLDRRKQFSWERAARETFDVYRRALGRKLGR